jgi:hypothetical protein
MREETGSLVRQAIVAEVGPRETVWTPEIVIGVVETAVDVVCAGPSPAPAGADEATVPVEIGPPDGVSESDRSGVKAITSVSTGAAGEVLVEPASPLSSGDGETVVTGRATRPGLRWASR